MQTVSERSAWIRRGWEDERKGWPPRDVPEKWVAAYWVGRQRAREDAERASREQG